MLVSRSSSSLSILPNSSSRGPTYWVGGLKGEGRGSIGAGRKGSNGFLGSKHHHLPMLGLGFFTVSIPRFLRQNSIWGLFPFLNLPCRVKRVGFLAGHPRDHPLLYQAACGHS